MRGLICPQPEKVPPFPEIHGHGQFRFQAVGQNAPGFLWGRAQFQKAEILPFRRRHGGFPDLIRRAVGFPETGTDKRQFLPEFLLTVITVPCTLLAVTGYPMAHNLMTDAAVTNNFHADGFMFNHGFMAPRNQIFQKLPIGCLRDVPFALVANPPDTFQTFEHGCAVNLPQKLVARFPDYHGVSSSESPSRGLRRFTCP